MKYVIFIDESGTLNKFKKEVFLITLLVVKKTDHKEMKEFSLSKINEFRLKNSISKEKEEEIKGHFLVTKTESFSKDEGKKIINEFFLYCLNKNKIIGGYVDNKDAKNKNKKNNKDTFYFEMINSLINRMIKEKWLVEGDEINLFLDARNSNLSHDQVLKIFNDNLINSKIKIYNWQSCDSKNHTMIQVVDYLAIALRYKIIKSLKNNKIIHKRPNLIVEKIIN